MKEKSEIHTNVVFEMSLRCVLKGKNKVAGIKDKKEKKILDRKINH